MGRGCRGSHWLAHCPRREGLACSPSASLLIRVNLFVFVSLEIYLNFWEVAWILFNLVLVSNVFPNTMVLDHDPEAIIILVLIKYVHIWNNSM